MLEKTGKKTIRNTDNTQTKDNPGKNKQDNNTAKQH